MTRKEFHRVCMSFREVEEGTSYGRPSYKAFGKFLTRLRDEDDSIVLGCVDFDEREMLCDAEPETFSGFLKGYARTAPINDKMTAVATFRLSAEVVA